MVVACGLCAGLRPAPCVRAFGPHLVCEVRLWLGLVRLRLGLGQVRQLYGVRGGPKIVISLHMLLPGTEILFHLIS